jgi:phosphopantothenoylcysteine decarboxylase/phosphopantothenate--cysteine ligase
MDMHARNKLEEKHLDMIAANLIGPADSGFASDTNRMTLFFADGQKEVLDVMEKDAVAHLILDRVAERAKQKTVT